MSTVLFGGTPVEAATTVNWKLSYTDQLCVPAYPIYAYSGGDTGSITGILSYYILTNQGEQDPIPAGYTVSLNPAASQDAVTFYQACSAPYQVVEASYSAHSVKDTYLPGEPVAVSVVAATGDQGNWHGIWGTGFIGSVGCFLGLFGGCSTPGVGASASFNSVQFVAVDGSGSAGPGTGTSTAPTTPGTYTIDLLGCYYLGTNCVSASMPFTVVGSAPAPTANLFFSP